MFYFNGSQPSRSIPPAGRPAALTPSAGCRARGPLWSRLVGSPLGRRRGGALRAGGGARAQVRRAGGGPAPRRQQPAGPLPARLRLSAPAPVTPPLCAFPRGWGALTRCASSSAPGCLACCIARTCWRGAGRSQGSPLSGPFASLASPRDCLSGGPFLSFSRVGSPCPGRRRSKAAPTSQGHLPFKSCPAFALRQAPPSPSSSAWCPPGKWLD